MWKRKNLKAGSQPPIYFSEAEHDPAMYDEPFAMGYTIVPSRGPPPSRPPREGLPRLPPQFENQKLQQTRRGKAFRPASSIYSQHSPNAPLNYHPEDTYRTESRSDDDYEISPPSSPEPGTYSKPSGYYQHSDRSVSPMDEAPTMNRMEVENVKRLESRTKTAASNIPILRRERRREQVANAAAKVESKRTTEGRMKQTKDPRWDPYTGEQTTSENGKPQSMKPKEYGDNHIHPATGLPLGNDSRVSSPPLVNSQSFGDRMRKLKIRTTPGERPEWKGASGRHQLVSPVNDQPDLPPLNVPRKSSRPSNSGSSTPVTATHRYGNETHYASPPMSGGGIDPRIRTVTSDDGQSPYNTPHSSSPYSAHSPWNTRKSSLTDAKTQARGYNSPVEVPRSFQRDESTTTIERNFHEALKDVHLPTVDTNYVQPPSRFSVSTYTPSVHSTPRPSMDSFSTPPLQQGQFQAPSPILNRKRPKYDSPVSAKATTRKAVAGNTPIHINMRNTATSTPTTLPPHPTPNPRLSTLSSTSKNLPPSPAEALSVDLISALEAQRDDLSHRRSNIERSIRQMTELMPTDHVILTEEVRRKREEEKRKVEGLRREEAEVRRCEHEVGLRLHRAWKRREREEVFECTGLWVRRVTG